MKLAIVGSRSLKYDEVKVRSGIKKYIKNKGNVTELVSGGADGADTFAQYTAKELGLPIKIFYPNWNKYGKSAGFKRNELIVEYADEVLAIYKGERTPGTANSVGHAKAMGKPYVEVFF